MTFDPIQGITWSEIRAVVKDAHAQDAHDLIDHLAWRPVCQAHLLEFLDRLVTDLSDGAKARMQEEVEDLQDQIDRDRNAHGKELRELREEQEQEREDLVEANEEEVTALHEEIASLRGEIARLRAEVEDYRRQNDVERDAIIRENVPTSWERVLGEGTP